MPNDAVFTEVLQVTVDAEAFKQGLDQLTQLYQRFVESVGADSASNILGVGAFQGLVDALNGVKETIIATNADEIQSFQELASQINTVVNTVKAGEEELQAVRERAVASARSSAGKEGPLLGPKTADDIGTRIPADSSYNSQIGKAQTEAEAEYLKMLHEAYALNEKFDIQQEASVRKLAKLQIDAQAEDKRRIEAKIQGEKDWAVMLEQAYAINAKLDAEREAAVRRLAALQMQASDEDTRRAQSKKKLAEEIALEQESLETKYQEQLEKDADKQTALKVRQKKLAEEIALEQESLETKYQEQLEKDADKQTALKVRQKKLAEEIALEQQGLEDKFAAQQESHAKKQSAGMEINLAQIAKYYVSWQLVGSAIQGVLDLLKSPFVALESGVTYLAKMQQEADNLTGALNANVTFSADVAENLRQSAEAAPKVVRALQDVSVKTGIGTEDLSRVFKIITESGGASVTGNLQSMVGLTEALSEFLLKSGLAANGLRSATTEIPKLLDGTLANTSKLAITLGLSGDELKKMVASAKEHGNLLELLEPKLKPYLSAVDIAQLHHGQMVERITLLKERLEGIAAGPIFETINKYLKQALDWLTDNKDKAESWALALGSVASELANNLVPLLGKLAPLTVPLAGTFALISYTLTTAASALRLLIDLALASQDILAPGKKAGEEAGKAFTEAYKRSLVTEKTYSDFFDALEGKFKAPAPSTTLTNPISNKKDNPSLDKTKSGIGEYRTEFLEDVAKIKDAYQVLEDAVQRSVKAQTASHREAAQQIGTLLDLEYQEVLAAASRFRAKIQSDPAASDAQKKKAKEDLEKTLAQTDQGFTRRGDSAIDQGLAEEQQIRKIHVQNILQLEQEKLKGLQALYKEEASAGYLTQVQLLALDTQVQQQAYQQRVRSIQAELAAVSSKTARYAELTAQINLIEEQHSQSVELNSHKRSQLLDEEAQRRRQNSIASGQLDTQIKTAELETFATQYKSRQLYEDIYILRQRDTDAKRQEILTELELARAKNVGSQATDKATLALKQNTLETLNNLKAELSDIRGLGAPRDITNRWVRQASAKFVEGAENGVAAAQGNLDKAKSSGIDEEANPEFATKVKGLTEVLSTATDKLKSIQDAIEPNAFNAAFSDFQQKFLGFDLQSIFSDPLATATEKATAAIEGLGGALESGMQVFNQFQQGAKKGGALGGVGSILSSGPVSDLLSSIPVVGAFVKPLGQIMSFVGSLFTAAARNIAEDIKKSFDKTIQAFQAGSLSISQTLQQVQQERVDAISRLSGIKGGKDELDKLLPQLDQEIASLQNQIKQTIQSFEEQFNILILNANTFNDALSQTYSSWVQINKQVQDYVNAGGDAATAAKFLSLSLQQILQTQQQALSQGEQQSIQDAIQLNDLIYQRIQLEQQYKSQVFALQNPDAIERANNGIISRAQQLQQQQLNYQQQITALNSQIELYQGKVDAERKIFNIASDINLLHQEDNALSLASLDLQLAKYASIKELISAIGQGPDGLYHINPSVFGNQGVSVGQINVYTQTPGGTIVDGSSTGVSIAQSIYQELLLLSRQFPTTP